MVKLDYRKRKEERQNVLELDFMRLVEAASLAKGLGQAFYIKVKLKDNLDQGALQKSLDDLMEPSRI